MAPPRIKARRATTDDLQNLEAAWSAMGFDTAALAKRVTEFQVVESGAGEFIGAVGLELAEKQGRIHSEAFLDYGLADSARPVLWERVTGLGRNHGLVRLWTTEQAPFWRQCGLVRADETTLEKIPSPWKGMDQEWATVKLREDVDALLAADADFALFMQAEKEKTQRTMRRARVFQSLITALGFLVFVLAAAAAYYILRKKQALLGR